MMGPQGRQKVKATILVALIKSGNEDITPVYSINESTSPDGRDIYLGGISEVFLATKLSKKAVRKVLKSLDLFGEGNSYSVELKADTYDNHPGFWMGAVFDSKNRFISYEKKTSDGRVVLEMPA